MPLFSTHRILHLAALIVAVGSFAWPVSGRADLLVQKRVDSDDYRPPISPAATVQPVQAPADGSVVAVWTDGEKVRRDEEAVSFIAYNSEGKLWIVYHRDRKYSHLAWPPRYERHRSSVARTLGGAASELLPFRLEGEIASRTLEREPFAVRRQEARVANGLGQAYRVTVDFATGVAEREAQALVAAYGLEHAISRLTREGHSPLDPLGGGAGVAVGWLLALQQPETEVRYSERVLGIEAREGSPPGGYAPPEGYERIPFDPPPSPGGSRPRGHRDGPAPARQ